MPDKQLLKIEGLSKRYPGVLALDNVSITLDRGEVHGLVGANGAGKSTLIKILAGAVQPDKGSIYVNGDQVIPLSPRKSQEIGIQVIHQELNLVPRMSVRENIFLGYEITSKKMFLNDREMRKASSQILDSLGVNIPPDVPLGDLSVSYQQMVAVAAALRRNAIILILDETTAAITGEEIDHLFSRIRTLEKQRFGDRLRFAPDRRDIQDLRSGFNPSGREIYRDQGSKEHIKSRDHFPHGRNQHI